MLGLFTQVAYAQEEALLQFVGVLNKTIFNPIIGILFGIAFVYFLYGVIVFIYKADNSAERKAGQNHMIWGIVGMAIMFSVFALMNFIIDTVGIEGIEIDQNEFNVDLPEADVPEISL